MTSTDILELIPPLWLIPPLFSSIPKQGGELIPTIRKIKIFFLPETSKNQQILLGLKNIGINSPLVFARSETRGGINSRNSVDIKKSSNTPEMDRSRWVHNPRYFYLFLTPKIRKVTMISRLVWSGFFSRWFETIRCQMWDEVAENREL